MTNLNLAFDIAEQHLDIPKMLDAEGIIRPFLCAIISLRFSCDPLLNVPLEDYSYNFTGLSYIQRRVLETESCLFITPNDVIG